MDHHAHSIERTPPTTVNELRGRFGLTDDARQWPHLATTVAYQRALSVLAETLGCKATEQALFERSTASHNDYSASLLRAAGADLILLDDAYPPPDQSLSAVDLSGLAGCRVRRVLRIEAVPREELPNVVRHARERGFVALKTISAYRGGLELEKMSPAARNRLCGALELNEATGDPLPVQIHTGIGDPAVSLPRADPSYLKPILERFRETNFVLLHCYPFVRQAGWLAWAYANVFLDLSLTIPCVARPASVLAEALELAPYSKLLYGSDAVRAPELYLLASVWWRDALAEVLPSLLPPETARTAARMILRENALSVYRLASILY